MPYQLGIDLGSTRTTVAIGRDGAPATRGPAVASAVFLGADGTFVVGADAQRRALAEPARVARDLLSRVGDTAPVVLGGQPVAPDVLVARFVAHLVRDVAGRERGDASLVAVTHPVGWGRHKLECLRAALAGQGVGPLELVAAPVAAALGYAAARPVPPGRPVAVYDLGASACTVTVIRAAGTHPGFEVVPAARGERIDGFGGLDVDDAVLGFVRRALGEGWAELDPDDPATLAAVERLRYACVAAKEALSVDTEARIPVELPGMRTTVRLTRAELEELIRPAVVATVDALRGAVESAGVTPGELAALLLTGGSANLPLVAELVPTGLGRAAAEIDPTAVVAVGAVEVARAAERRRTAAAAPAASPVKTRVLAPAQPVPAPDPAPARPAAAARPFTSAQPEASPRRTAVLVTGGILVALLAGGAVAVAATQSGLSKEAVATTPTPAPPSSTAVQRPGETTPVPQVPQQAPRTDAPAPTTRPPVPTTTPPKATDKPDPTAPSEPSAPADRIVALSARIVAPATAPSCSAIACSSRPPSTS
ncbi:MAG: Hsp70 family protein, partial [Pseudonocardia sp.]|nr:Hsp70 family protein [Pseudonocardia sp.]